MWLGFGVGAPKQFFIIKKVGDKLRGMVCGTCDNPYTMAALDDFVIEGDTLKFNILHEDWGDGEIPRSTSTSPHAWAGTRCDARRPLTTSHHRLRRRPGGSRDSRCRVRFPSTPQPATSGPPGPPQHLVTAIATFTSSRAE